MIDKPLRILIVENHEDTMKYLQLYLDQNDDRVDAARSVGEAKEKLRSQKYDLLLCDIGLPDGSGWEVPAGQADRIGYAVAMSGFGRFDDPERSARAGFDCHLTKPFLPPEIDEILAKIRANGVS